VLPLFDERGYLPPGIHRCSLDDLLARFGSGSPEREVESQELIDFINWARKAGIQRVIVNGSYVTEKMVPNDVDIVALPGPDYPRGEVPCTEQESRWPFLQILIAADESDLVQWATQDFGTDRKRNTKGVVEVII
jgi:hypothetical protein